MLHLKWLYNKLFSPSQPPAEPPKWMDLPANVTTQILQSLPAEDILHFSQASKATHQAAMAPALWQKLIKLYFKKLNKSRKYAYKQNPFMLFKEAFEDFIQNSAESFKETSRSRLDERLQRNRETELHIRCVANGDFQYLDQLDFIDIIDSFNLAMKNGKSDITIQLWERLNNHQKSFYKTSVLIAAAKQNDFKMAKLLLSDTQSNDFGLKIAIDRAYKKGNFEMAAFLRDHKNGGKWNVRKIISRVLTTIFSTIQTNHFRKLSLNMARHVNVDECFPEDRPKWDAGFPQALIAESTYANFASEAWLDRMLSNPLLPGDLAQRFHVHERPISSLSSLCGLIKNISSLGPIQLLILRGHGNEHGFALENGAIYASTTGINKEISCLGLLAKNAIIILESCNTGYNSSQPMNLQKFISLSAPGRTVFASDFYTIKSSLGVQFYPELKVHALGFNSDSIPSTLLGVLWGYLRWGFFGRITKTQYSAYYPAIVTDPLHAVSTANTTTPTFEALPPMQSNYFYTGMYSMLCATTTALAREHLKFKHAGTLLTFLGTQGIQLGFQIANTSTSMLPTILCLNLLSLPGTVLQQYPSQTLTNLKSLIYGGYLGFLFYKCYQEPEQLLTTTLELTTAIGGSLMGEKFGQYAYRRFVRQAQDSDPRSLPPPVEDKPIQISAPKLRQGKRTRDL